MNLLTTTTAIAAILLAGACSQRESEEGVIPEGYKSAVEKARGVEDTLEETLQMHREEMDESER